MILMGLTISQMVNAQGVVTGTNLNIGTDNTLTPIGNGIVGNAIGMNHFVQASSTLSVGNMDSITTYGYNSVAFGSVNKVAGSSSMAVGSNVKVLNSYSIGMGRHLKVAEESSVVIGNGITNPSIGPDVVLENPYNHSLMIGFRSSKPTFTVGPSNNNFNEVVNRTGKVAIGDVPIPDIAAKLHIRSDYNEDAGIFLEPKDSEHSKTFILLKDEYHQIKVDNIGNMTIESKDGNTNMPLFLTGKVGINVPNANSLAAGYALCVHGGIITEKVNIKSYSEWHDYVLAPEYALMPLPQLKDYITAHRHLPNIPSEQEVLSEGVEIGEMQGLLLKKIEELTLYSIQLQEQIGTMQKEIDELKNK